MEVSVKDPDKIIADYLAAYEAANGYAREGRVYYEGGWVRGIGWKGVRLSELKNWTANLRRRAEAPRPS